jgi:hypothetical protein
MRTEQARKTEAVALVSNSVGQMVKPKGSERKHFLNEAIDLVAEKFKAARERKETDSKQPQAEKTLASRIAGGISPGRRIIRQGCSAATHYERSGQSKSVICCSRQFLTPFLAGCAFSLP